MATFEGRVLFYSTKALRFIGHYWAGPLWFPRSQVEVEEDGEGHVIKVSTWLSNKRGLEEFTEYDEAKIEEFDQL